MKKYFRLLVIFLVFSCWIPHIASAQAINVPDPNLAAALRRTLVLAPNANITIQDMQRLRRLLIFNTQITNLTGLEHATRLEALVLNFNKKISDLSPLVGLTQLVHLQLGGNQISNLNPLTELKQLRVLDLADNQISDLSPLAGLTQLESLYLSSNQIRNVNPLDGLTQLQLLYLSNNQISDIRPLDNLTQLQRLYLASNQISDIRPLAGFTNLSILHLANNRISDVTPLARLTRLPELWLNQNNIRDVSALAGLVNLRTLKLAGNPITDTSPLAKLTNLVEVDVKITAPTTPPRTTVQKPDPPSSTVAIPDRNLASAVRKALGLGSNASITKQNMQKLSRLIANGQQIRNLTGLEHAIQLEVLNLESNLIQDVSPLAGLTQIKWLYLRRNQIQNVSPLMGLTRLSTLQLAQNNIRDVSPLAKLVNLRTLRLRGNPITDTSPLAGLPETTNVDLKISQQPTTQVKMGQGLSMYWIATEAGTLHRLVGNEVENFVPAVQNATSLAVDSTNNKIYWTEKMGNRGRIKRANFDGSNVEILATVFGVPRSIAVDTMRSKLYWTDSRGRIKRSNFNGKQIRNLVQNLNSPDNIVVDVQGAKLYWTEAPGNIRSSNLNGKGIEDIASGLRPVGGIAILGNRIYWTETIQNNRGRIGRANLNGSNIGTLGSPRSALSDIAADSVDNKLYWTDAGGNIRAADLKIRGFRPVTVVSGLTSPGPLALGSSSVMTAAAPANSSHASVGILTPDATDLLTNYPNPFNPETWIPYQLAESADAQITIYNVHGTIIRNLELGHQAAGVYQNRSRAAYWDGRNALGEPVASGVYFYTLTAGDFTATRKMLIRK